MGDARSNDDVVVECTFCHARTKIIGEAYAREYCYACRNPLRLPAAAVKSPWDTSDVPGFGDDWVTKPIANAPARYLCRGCGDYFEGIPPVSVSPCCDTPNPVKR